MNKKLCASPKQTLCWERIDFIKVQNEVNKLQMRIAKAVKENRFGKVKSLQWTLTHSFNAKALAVKRVCENKGKNTPGIDGVVWKTPKEKFQAVIELKQRGYNPEPLRRIYIPKKNGKKRPLSIPTMKDRAMQMLYKFALEPVVETLADSNSYGFRPKRCVQDAVEACFGVLAKRNDAQWVLEGDIKGCFDNISHEWILENICMDKEILKKFLEAGYIETSKLFPTSKGTPQGGTISPIICNAVLDGLEKELNKKFFRTSRQGVMFNPKVNYVRYADDFIITGENKDLLENEVLPIVENFMKERGLSLSKEKTLITHIDDGFNFLGINIRKYNGKLLTKPSKENHTTFLRKVRGIIKGNKSSSQYELIRILNPIIRGWVNFHQHNVSTEAFRYTDYQIFEALWKWCTRRHPNKGKKWIKNKYFNKVGTRF